MIEVKALEFLASLAKLSAEPKRIAADDPYVIRYVSDGKILEFDAEPKSRAHKAGTLDDLVALANRFEKKRTEDGVAQPVVWYDAEAVVLVTDDDGHRVNTATFAPEVSDVFAKLVWLRGNPLSALMEHKPFIRLLRIDLSRAIDAVHLLEVVRKVRFENGQTTTAEVGRQRESLGREITSKVDASKEIPEEVTLSVPVYKTPGETERYPVRCSVECEPAEGKFRLLPMPDEIERVRSLAVASFAERLGAGLDGVPFYQGKP